MHQLQEIGERLKKYKRKYNKLRGVVPECPTISGSSISDSEESLQAKERRKQRNKVKRARRQAQQAAERKHWEQQQQDLLKQIAQLQGAQASQPAEALTWRHVGVMLHLRSTHPGIGPLELPGQWR